MLNENKMVIDTFFNNFKMVIVKDSEKSVHCS